MAIRIFISRRDKKLGMPRVCNVAKVVELIGCSAKGWDDAVQVALRRAVKSIRNISGLHVVGMKAKVEKGRIVEYKAVIRVVFGVE